MTVISQIEAKELNEQIDPLEILRLIGYHKSSPKISGNEVRDFCPIHQGDNQRSLSINQENHLYICHNCGARGDLIDLYVKATAIAFPEALENLSSYFQPNSLFKKEPPFSSQLSVSQKTPTPSSTLSPQERWNKCSKEGNHHYLAKKKISFPPGIRFGQDDRGNHSIVVPFCDVDGHLQTLQFINEQGKFFLKGHSCSDSFFTLGSLQDSSPIYIAEGMATAVTIWEALEQQFPVVSVGSAGNISAAISAIRKKYPAIKIKLALDDSKAAKDALKKIDPPFSYTIPNFSDIPVPKEEKADDFNDLVALGGLSLDDVRQQLKQETSIDSKDFFGKLGCILDDQEFAIKLKERSYEAFEKEHKDLFSSGGLITGFKNLDEQMFFSKGDFITFQGMSNHGKSTLMLNIAYRFLAHKANKDKDPMFLFVTYESTPLRIEEKLLNIISHEHQEGTFIRYHQKNEDKYLYPTRENFRRTINAYNSLLKERKAHILKKIPLEQIGNVIDLYKEEFPNRTIAIFLDYIQIIDTSLKSGGWEKIKNIAYALEALAIEKEVILATASQVNEKRQAREGRDIFNASTINIDIFNHSHTSIENNEDFQKLYRKKIDGKNICTLEVRKQKYGPSFALKDYLLFNGHMFEERIATQKTLKQGNFDDLT